VSIAIPLTNDFFPALKISTITTGIMSGWEKKAQSPIENPFGLLTFPPQQVRKCTKLGKLFGRTTFHCSFLLQNSIPRFAHTHLAFPFIF